MDKSLYTKPELREKLFEQIKAGTKGGKAGQWSARKAQLLAKEYEAAGGGYKKKKSQSQKSLSKWTDEDWMTSETFKNEKKGKSKEIESEGKRRYLPKKAWQSLSEEEIEKTNSAKARGNKKKKQFVPQPKAIADKVKKYR